MPEFPAGLTFADFVARRAAEHPDRVFVRLVRRDGRRESLTFGALEERTAQVARAFLAGGAVPGDRVLILARTCLEMVVTILAAARSGLVSVPVNTASVPADVAFLVELVEPAVVVVGADLVHLFGDAGIPDGAVNRAVVVGEPAVGTRWARSVEGWDDLVADGRRRDGAPLVTPAATDLFQLLMTSGTTGRPKAVMHSHATRIRSAYRGVLHGRVRDDDVLLNPFPPFHINCLDAALLPALVTGCTAVVLEAFSASAFWGTVRREGATVVSVMPTVVRAVIATPERDDDTDHRVRLVLGALRPTPAELERFLRRFAIPNYETGYGLTEAGMAVTQTVRDLDPHFPSIGIPMFDRTVDLFDAAGRSVPVGAAGEIVVSRAPAGGVMDGYWRDPEATALALAGGWLRTGDLARRDDDGFFYFVGRVKDVIKRSGENIGAEEVEAVLLEHPGVRDVAVIGVPDSYRDEAVMAFLVPEPGGAELTLEAIRGFCHGRIAAFKVPSVISVVSDLPRGVLGKIDKKALRAGVALAAAGQSGDERHV